MMRIKINFHFIFFRAALFFLLLLLSCGRPDNSTAKFKIILSGTEKLRYTGFYKTISPAGVVTSNTVSGVLPAEYHITNCKSLICSFIKEADKGELKMSVLDENGAELKNESTTISYGSIQLVTDF